MRIMKLVLFNSKAGVYIKPLQQKNKKNIQFTFNTPTTVV